MGAYEELLLGEFGESTIHLLYTTVADVARISRFPPPEGSQQWDADAVQGAAHGFVVAGGIDKVRKVMLKATDQGSLERLLTKTVQNHLRDLARQTVKGRLGRSLTRRLKMLGNVSLLGGEGASAVWMIAGGDPDGSAPSVGELIASSYQLDGLVVARTVANSQRGRALIDGPTLDAVVLDALGFASCPLDSATLLEVIVARFPLLVEGDDVELRHEHANEPTLSESHPDPGLVSAKADEIWAQLNHRERLVLTAADGAVSTRELAERLNISKSSANRAVTSAKAVLTATLQGTTDRTAVVGALLNRSTLLAGGTNFGTSPSSSDLGGIP